MMSMAGDPPSARTVPDDPASSGLGVVDLPGSGPPIVFLHGLGGASTLDYARTAAASTLQTRRRVLVDMPGFGASARRCAPGLDHSIAGYAAFLDDWLESVPGVGRFDQSKQPVGTGTPVVTGIPVLTESSGEDDLRVESVGVPASRPPAVAPDQRARPRVILFGHSAGGAVALSLAALRPERVAGVILTEANLDAGGGTASRAIAGRSEESFIRRGHAALVRTERAKSNPWSQTVALADPVALHREACSLVAGATPSWRDILYGLTCPKAYVFGERNLPDPDATELLRHGVEVMTVPNAGHNMAWENPDGLAAVIARFMKGVAGGS
ncbi:MAG: alpha/beta hydrolase [Propionibacteriaceae bacterium]|jgi:pimeloyl-ACP methyl ester carboxylesterase|nr:alpha/beta hydrolase [Propionibacteriaceae bacterium]